MYNISLKYIVDTLLYTGCGFHSSSNYNDNCYIKVGVSLHQSVKEAKAMRGDTDK